MKPQTAIISASIPTKRILPPVSALPPTLPHTVYPPRTADAMLTVTRAVYLLFLIATTLVAADDVSQVEFVPSQHIFPNVSLEFIMWCNSTRRPFVASRSDAWLLVDSARETNCTGITFILEDSDGSGTIEWLNISVKDNSTQACVACVPEPLRHNGTDLVEGTIPDQSPGLMFQEIGHMRYPTSPRIRFGCNVAGALPYLPGSTKEEETLYYAMKIGMTAWVTFCVAGKPCVESLYAEHPLNGTNYATCYKEDPTALPDSYFMNIILKNKASTAPPDSSSGTTVTGGASGIHLSMGAMVGVAAGYAVLVMLLALLVVLFVFCMCRNGWCCGGGSATVPRGAGRERKDDDNPLDQLQVEGRMPGSSAGSTVGNAVHARYGSSRASAHSQRSASSTGERERINAASVDASSQYSLF